MKTNALTSPALKAAFLAFVAVMVTEAPASVRLQLGRSKEARELFLAGALATFHRVAVIQA